MFKLIVSMSLPAMFSMLVQSLYNVVDSYFVAQISEEALTAVSLAYPVQMLLVAVAVGTGVGINSVVSRAVGRRAAGGGGSRRHARNRAGHPELAGICRTGPVLYRHIFSRLYAKRQHPFPWVHSICTR